MDQPITFKKWAGDVRASGLRTMMQSIDSAEFEFKKYLKPTMNEEDSLYETDSLKTTNHVMSPVFSKGSIKMSEKVKDLK
jgi:hypothetical protein